MDHHARVNVFGHGLGTEPVNFHQHTTTEQSAASRKECAIMPIAAQLENAVEQRLLIFEDALELQILLKHVRVVEMVRRLDKRHLLVLEESYRVPQEAAGRDVIDIEYRNDFSRGFLQGMVQISGFRVLSVRAADVSAVHRRG